MKRRTRGEKGASSVELVLYTPVLFFIIFLIVQFALTWHGNQVASATAREAARVARIDGGTPAALARAEAHGRSYAAQVGDGALRNVTVEVVTVGGNEIRATVTGRSVEIVNGFAPRVSHTVQGPIEEFRPDL
jgi:Flp pilus assembly protein TadG